MLLASDSPADGFTSLPWWVQLLLGCAGVYATVLALF